MKVYTDQRCVIEFLHTKKKCAHQHSFMLVETKYCMWAQVGIADVKACVTSSGIDF